jgi:threonine synthase
MRYLSTRGQIEAVSFQDAVMMGLADDGGLLIPEVIPDVRDRLEAWRALPYPALAQAVLELFATDVPAAELGRLIEQSYARTFPPDVAPVRRVGPVHVLELFHGPTLAFKDVALQFLGHLFEFILQARGGELNILAATSGDTGSAAIHGVRGRDRIRIFVMHPHGRTSPIQARQMTTVLDENVHNLAVEGTFDDAQRILKELAGDLDFKRRHSLGAVNSVNWARVLAQIVYYFHAAFRVTEATGAEAVRVSVPTGNFGDILAGWYAMRMGAPLAQLVLATNRNDILSRFFNTGEYRLGDVHSTASPSMDIQVASNFERYLYYALGEDPAALRRRLETFRETGSLSVPVGPEGAVDPVFAAGAASEEETLATIGRFAREHDYVLDPHTAVGVHVAGVARGPELPVVCLATAHPAKFPDAVRQATGRDDLARHPAIEALDDLPERCEVVPATTAAVRRYLESVLAPA